MENKKNNMTEREIRELIKRIEQGKNNNTSKDSYLSEEYKKQTDKNYKDGDRN